MGTYPLLADAEAKRLTSAHRDRIRDEIKDEVDNAEVRYFWVDLTDSPMTQTNAISGVERALAARPGRIDYISVYGFGPNNDLKLIWSREALPNLPANTLGVFKTSGLDFVTGDRVGDLIPGPN